MTPDLATLRRLVDLAETLREALPKIDPAELDSYAAHRTAGTTALQRLVTEEDARVSTRGTDLTLTMAGIRSSCTWGHSGLLLNWAMAARKQIRALEAGGAS